MNFSFVSGDPAKLKADVLLLPLVDDQLGDKKHSSSVLRSLNEALDGLLLESAQEEGFKARADQSLLFHPHRKLGASRVVLLGLGPRARLTPETLRMAAGRGAKIAQRLKARQAVFCLPEPSPNAELARAAVEGLMLGSYRFDRYRTTQPDEKNAPKLAKVQLWGVEGGHKDKHLEAAVRLGRQVAEATNWARDLVNEPAAEITPSRLAEHAKAVARAAGLTVHIGGQKEIAKLKMGMFLGVARGSVEEPKLIHLIYTPKNPAHAKRPPVALVGKAITFDSGGLSLKTADGMVDMKTDMAGSAAVLGAMRVIGELKPPFPVHAFMGACENMPAGNAYRPGDILVSRLGKTVEITNTDAEGRLVLGDVLAYANDLKPGLIVDLATLTGACMIALGHYLVGAFGEDEPAMQQVLSAAKQAGEELWRMPISDLQKDALRSEVADMKNSGERWGGAINAAVFLREFVGATPWVHLDIAGPSQSPKERGYYSKGATGVGVRTLVELIRQRTQQA